MDNRCRGANGEVRGEAGDEYALFCDIFKELRRFRGSKGGILRDSVGKPDQEYSRMD